ncbi:RCC1/BLIP-II [Byssothecium circinans]|uniref:RCC1/BLIP-II n=1 Tax=Byssothecium circinans TaxID=147558 RepID=A0A6A5U3S7_9PLEO|nr:RCC1/BLIP-II [Byssothecium circinans]
MPYRLYVFGSNGEGQLGIPAQEILDKPTIAPSWPPQETLRAIRSGDNHTLFLTPSGQIFVTGYDRQGQIGNSFTNGTQVKLEHIQKTYSGIDLCAATCESSAYIANPSKSDGAQEASLTTEGTSRWGEVGLGVITSTLGHTSEEIVQKLPDAVVDIAAGGWHYVLILANGEVFGWGKARLEQLGVKLLHAPQQRVRKPTRIEEDIPFKPVKVACGKEFTYLVADPEDGRHYLLGCDKLGLRTDMPENIKGWKQIAASWNAIYVLFGDGRLIAWGKDNLFQLVPDDLPLIEKIAVGSEHVLALTRDGKLISWGWGTHGNCGDLSGLGDKVKNDIVSGVWNEIDIPGRIHFVGAGFCTSFVLTEISGE